MNVARKVAEIRYGTKILTEEEFYAEKKARQMYHLKTKKAHELFSANTVTVDSVLRELASRERANRSGLLNTIVCMRYKNHNVEISGFIDFAESLKDANQGEGSTRNWKEIFKENERIGLRKNDLGYYNWSNGYVIKNDSTNFKVIADPVEGLIFENKHDRHRIIANPYSTPPNGTTRTVVQSDLYEHVVLYDHVLRNK